MFPSENKTIYTIRQVKCIKLKTNRCLLFQHQGSVGLTSSRCISTDKYGNYQFRDRLKYVLDVKDRVLPNLRLFKQSDYTKLLGSKSVKSYFKGIRKLQEYPGLMSFFRNRKFDLSLYHQIKKENKNVQEKFLSNIESCKGVITCRDRSLLYNEITENDLKFLDSRILIDMFPNHNLSNFVRPTMVEVLSRVNLRASQGLPDPALKKRDILDELTDLLDKFYSKTLKTTDIILYPTATLMRLQIRSSGLKIRVVHAVQAKISVLESYFYLWFMSGLPSESCIKIGLTQNQISENVMEYKHLNTYCFDYSKWDFTRKQVLSVLSFEVMSRFLNLSSYEMKFLKFLRNYYLTVPMFHPHIDFARRLMGTVSGSGFTSLDNSICNYLLFVICYRRYMSQRGLDPNDYEFKISVCGDDLVFGTNFDLNPNEFTKFVDSEFGVTMGLELPTQSPNVDKLFFLGSLWIDGNPIRSQKVMVASVIFGSGNFPKMTPYELLTSRFLEVFGNSSDCLKYWDRLGIDRIPSRRFHFQELKEYREDSRGKISPKSDLGRGVWLDTIISRDELSTLWKNR